MRKVIFLDRDGVINSYPGDSKYVRKWSEFHFLPGVLKSIRKLTEANFKIFIISNQAGVAKGIYTEEELKRITKKMLSKIEESGGEISGVYYCLHRAEDNCSCRKPKIGLFKKAISKLNVSLKDCFFIGDSLTDVEAGRRAGCKTILLLCGQTKLKSAEKWPIRPDFIARDLTIAVESISNENLDNLRFGGNRP